MAQAAGVVPNASQNDDKNQPQNGLQSNPQGMDMQQQPPPGDILILFYFIFNIVLTITGVLIQVAELYCLVS